MSALQDLYETDFYAWTRVQVRELRHLDARSLNAEVDLRDLVEEVWGVGDSQRDACFSQISRVLEHLLKLQFSPAARPRLGWKRSIAEARGALDRQLTIAIERRARRRISRLYRHASKLAVMALEDHREDETARRVPPKCPYTLDDVLREDWYPEPDRD